MVCFFKGRYILGVFVFESSFMDGGRIWNLEYFVFIWVYVWFFIGCNYIGVEKRGIGIGLGFYWFFV